MIMYNISPVSLPPDLPLPESFSGWERLLFFDIETTGLSPSGSQIYLIGALAWEGKTYTLLQWFAKNPAEEKDILTDFLHYQEKYPAFVHYNGSRFDLPFLKARCQRHGLFADFIDKPSLDLFREFAPLQRLLKLSDRRLPTLEAFLGLERDGDVNGRDGIRLFREYCRIPRDELLVPLLEHNRRDLLCLPQLFSLYAYLCLLEGKYSLLSLSRQDDGLILTLKPALSLPRLFSYGADEAYITGEDRLCRVRLTLTKGRLKKYYANWKDYDYLPGEDTAIPKSLGQFMDRSLRQRASKETCYTWFPFSPSLEKNLPEMETYLKENLPRLLGFF